MKFSQFTYTKTNGETTARTVCVAMQPSKFLEGYDISDLDPDALVEFAEAYNKIHDEYAAKLQNIAEQFDVNYKRFTINNITNQTTEYI